MFFLFCVRVQPQRWDSGFRDFRGFRGQGFSGFQNLGPGKKRLTIFGRDGSLTEMGRGGFKSQSHLYPHFSFSIHTQQVSTHDDEGTGRFQGKPNRERSFQSKTAAVSHGSTDVTGWCISACNSAKRLRAAAYHARARGQRHTPALHTAESLTSSRSASTQWNAPLRSIGHISSL